MPLLLVEFKPISCPSNSVVPNASSYQGAKTAICLLKSLMSRAAGLATGHAPSPYLRRLRLPNLGTYRPHDTDEPSPEEEYNKLELIRLRMEERKLELNQKTEQLKSQPETKAPFYHPDNLFQVKQEKSGK